MKFRKFRGVKIYSISKVRRWLHFFIKILTSPNDLKFQLKFQMLIPINSASFMNLDNLK